jgi:hypothetical protein
MTRDDLEIIAKGVADFLKEYLAPLDERIKALEQQPFEYLGVHEYGKAYRKNAVVTRNGGLWIAKADTVLAPGDGPDWQLAVRAGRDAR